jgi:hypothetical protein
LFRGFAVLWPGFDAITESLSSRHKNPHTVLSQDSRKGNAHVRWRKGDAEVWTDAWPQHALVPGSHPTKLIWLLAGSWLCPRCTDCYKDHMEVEDRSIRWFFPKGRLALSEHRFTKLRSKRALKQSCIRLCSLSLAAKAETILRRRGRQQ